MDNYEEKYKKALSWMQGLYKGLHGKTKEEAEEAFPELKESEDEEIRKFLIQMAQNGHGEDRDWWNKCVEWLEKQGEQKPAWSEEDDIMKQHCHQMLALLRPNSSELTKDIIDNCHHWLKSIKSRVQPKIEWSERDELMLEASIDFIRSSPYSYSGDTLRGEISKNEAENWLKSLKERVQPQPKQEWSEEDEDMRYKATAVINRLCADGKEYVWSISTLEKLFYWLKSLRPQNRCTYNPYKEVVESIAEMCEKYEDANLDSLKDFYSNVKVKCKDAKEYDSLFPQSTWKPSDEQLDSLYDVLNPCDGFNREVLESLYVQLKKLREG